MIFCSNELISRIRTEEIDARSFLISTNLAFGTVRLYKAQIDKLYGKFSFILLTTAILQVYSL